MKKRNDRKSLADLRRVLELSAVGWQLVISIVIGFVVGHLLDAHFNTEPIFTAVCFLLGAAAGFVALFRAAGVKKKG